MMFFFDTYAIIEIIKDNQDYRRFRDERMVTSTLNIGELYWSLLREWGRDRTDAWFEGFYPEIVDGDRSIVIEAVRFRFLHRKQNMSLVDCIGYVLARKHQLKFLTGDKEFQHLENVEFVR